MKIIIKKIKNFFKKLKNRIVGKLCIWKKKKKKK